MAALYFFVAGVPQPGGSKRGFVNKSTGRVVITEDCRRNKDWRASVVYAAREEMGKRGIQTMTGPVRLKLQFQIPRPKGHYGTGRNEGRVRGSAPEHPATRPDTTKLVRSTEDALTDAGVWRDDAQVVQQVAHKTYGDTGGAWVSVEEI